MIPNARASIGFRVPSWRRWLLRAVVSTVALTYLLITVDGQPLVEALRRMPGYLLPVAVAAHGIIVGLAALRWSLLLQAFGALRRPKLATLAALQWEGLFYNTFVPGAVAGDVVRAVATRRHLVPDDDDNAGLAAAGSVILVERVLGLAGMLLLVAGTFAWRPTPGVQGVWLWSGLGLAVAVIAIFGITFAGRVSAALPGAVGRVVGRLPALKRWIPLLYAVLCAIVSHALVAGVGHLWIASLDDRVRLLDSLCLIPVAMAAAYFPLTIAGAGAIETAMVVLYDAIGVLRADTLAAALMMQLAKLIAAASGAVMAWRRGLP